MGGRLAVESVFVVADLPLDIVVVLPRILLAAAVRYYEVFYPKSS